MRLNYRTCCFRRPLAGTVALLALLGVSAPAASDELGRAVYRRACAACHGNAGDGQSAVARYLDPRPRDFTLGLYKFNSTPTGLPPTDEDIYRTIERGVPTTSMPAFGDLLSDDEIHAVATYIKTFSDVFATMPAVEPVAIPEAPDMTTQSVANGKSIYMMTGCWTCHGPRGRGEGDAAAILKDASGFEVRPVDFTKGHYKGGNDAASIFRSIETGFLGTPMAGFAAAFAYGRDSARLTDKIGTVYDASEIAGAQAYIDAQPTRAEIGEMEDADRDRLIAERKWALVHFLQSLAEPPSVWHRLFWADLEVAP